MNNLTKNETKLLKKIINIIAILSLILLIPSTILIFIGNLFLEPVFYFPIILSSVFLIYVYKFYKTLKMNDGLMSRFKLKLILLSYARSLFLSLTYLTIVVKSYFETIFFLFFAFIGLVCEIILKRYDK